VHRRTYGNIHKAAIQKYYYVAGPKKTQLTVRVSAELYKGKDFRPCALCAIFMRTFRGS
jgi:hypothetical protein